jgi:DNA polymerase zeta
MGWIHEEEYRGQIDTLIKEEKDKLQGAGLKFETFVKPPPHEDTVNTALQSVEDLFPSNLMSALGLPSNASQAAGDPASSIDVDDQRVQRAQEGDDDFFPNDSDEEVLRELSMPNKAEDERLQSHGGKVTVGDDDQPTALDPMGTLGQNLAGLCASGLKTGRIPKIPICQELLDAAEDEGLVGRTRRAPGSAPSLTPALKRKSSGDARTIPVKRVKQTPVSGNPAEPNSSQLAPHTRRSPNDLNTDGKPSLSQESRLSQRSGDTSGSNQILNFPVVKDPTDLHAMAQRSQKPASQHKDTSQKKQVTFGPISSFSELPLGSSFSFHSSPVHLGESGTQSQLSMIQASLGSFAPNSRMLIFAARPPDSKSISSSMEDNNMPNVLYQDAYYSKDEDVPARPREYAGREFRLESNTVPFLPSFDPTGTSPASYGIKGSEPMDKSAAEREFERQCRQCSWRSWELAQPPPTYEDVRTWWNEKTVKDAARNRGTRRLKGTPRRYLSQIDGPTPKNKHGFAYTQKKKSTSVEHEAQYMSTMSIEIHVNTRGKLVPNPEEDEVQCIFWSIKSDEIALNSQDPSAAIQSGIIVLSTDGTITRRIQRQSSAEVVEEASELDLLVRMVGIVRNHDPDILTGYEVHGSSWGYLIERARLKYDYSLCDEFSRTKTESHGRFGKENDRWGFNTTSTIRITGRHMINVWRAMRGELNLLQYTMENVVWHVLHRRIPHYSWKTLTQWYRSGKPQDLSKLVRYYQIRTRLDIEILEANELVPRTSEQARLLGVDFFSVFSRGSQFKVESIMFRIAKPENFLLVSPSRKQVGGQNALECLPLVMEPQSAFYTSPLLVLDFQSLYPSVMIAYNYCYSTFLGRITSWRGMNKMGFTEYKRQQGLLSLLQDYINIAPNGMMYVKPEIRKSLLAKMLTEILETRVMVKSGMKKDKDDKMLQQLLNNRQLALKLLANVTYGYTSASFSGRMPCSEIADSIVQTGRETLERAIAYIHSEEKWGAEVVYGDTDSLFVYIKGKTRDQAFDIGNEIAKAITDMNPRPVKLKFEKVYHPCVLLAKKRYVGYKFESKGQVKPDFDAKGIETVRRDGTPAEQKIEEKVLKLLFDTADLSQVKAYFQAQCEKIMRGSVSVQDFCFAREVRLGTYSDKGVPPAGALISTKRMLEDARAEPQYGERVPYVVITGAPGARLIDRCVAPEDLLANPHWQLDAEYYISKNLIPPLERIFNLVGANVRGWYDEMPKIQRIHQHAGQGGRKTTLESYMKSMHCLVCSRRFTSENNGGDGGTPLCPACRSRPDASLLTLQSRLTTEERRYEEVLSVCRSCSGLSPVEEVRCDSKDCPVFWTRMRQLSKVRQERAVTEPVIRGLVESVDRLALEW